MRNIPVVGNLKELFALPSQRELGASGRELPTETIVFVVVVVMVEVVEMVSLAERLC